MEPSNNFQFLKELDSLEFQSLISDPTSTHSQIIFSQYPFLRDLLKLETLQSLKVSTIVEQNEAAPSESFNTEENKIELKVEVDTIEPPAKNIELDEKYVLFCKWLEDSSNVKPEEDNFSDEDDVFEDTSDAGNNPAVLEENIIMQEISTPPANTEMESISPTINTGNVESSTIPDEHIYETLMQMPLPILEASSLLSIQTDLSDSRRSSASDLTIDSFGVKQRRITHNKGLAPLPPVVNVPVRPVTPDSIRAIVPVSKEEHKPVGNTKVPEKKRGFFSYIPQILKPISPATSSKNIPKETEI